MQFYKHDVLYFNPTGTQSHLFDKHPSTCPICDKGMDPRFIQAVVNDKNFVQAVFQCPFDRCNNLFIAEYHRETHGYDELNVFKRTYPYTTPIKESFEEVIQKISPIFCDIYNQALFATSFHLDHITGPGYRKSLEFLIKDYAISINPEDKEKIEITPLSKVINSYINDNKIKEAAKRATWLGNDETHYFRKWVSTDIHDLIILIKLTVNFIVSENLLINYKKTMP